MKRFLLQNAALVPIGAFFAYCAWRTSGVEGIAVVLLSVCISALMVEVMYRLWGRYE